MVVVVSGRTGAVLYDLPVSDGTPARSTPISKSVAVVGDLDGDGARDLAVFNEGPGVEVFSLATGERIRQIDPGAGFGGETAVAGCASADGRCALVVGDPSASGSLDAPEGRVFVFTTAAVATEPEPSLPALAAWPNPASHRVRVAWDGGVRTIRVLDALGRVVATSSGAGRADLDTSGLRPGVYLVVAEARGGARAAVRVTVTR